MIELIAIYQASWKTQ